MAITTIQGILMVGDRASQPAANTVATGALYAVDDEDFLIEQSDGADWNQYGPTPAAAAAITSLTGDVTGTGPGATAATIANDAVTYAKMQNVSATSRVLCRKTAGAGNVEEGTFSEVLDFVGSAAQGDILYRNATAWVRLPAGTADEVLTTHGAGADPTWEPSSGSGSLLPSTNEYRLSATTAVAVTTADVTTTSTLYWTPYNGLHCSVYDGAANWVDYTGGELNIALSSLTADKNYDVFLDYNGGTEQLVLVAWTDDTNRATALTFQDGILVLTGATDHRYLGTIRTIATNATCDFGGGTTSLVGGRRYIWNYYNRKRRSIKVFTGTNSWNYSTNTWRQADADTGANYKFEFVIGVAEDAVQASYVAIGQTSANSVNGLAAIGLDSITAPIANSMMTSGQLITATGGVQVAHPAHVDVIPSAGFHYMAPLEIGNGTATQTWHGDAGVSYLQSGMTGNLYA